MNINDTLNEFLRLPRDLEIKIFSNLNKNDLLILACVSRRFNEVASDDRLWIKPLYERKIKYNELKHNEFNNEEVEVLFFKLKYVFDEELEKAFEFMIKILGIKTIKKIFTPPVFYEELKIDYSFEGKTKKTLVMERVRKYIDTLAPILFDEELKKTIDEMIKKTETSIFRIKEKIDKLEITVDSVKNEYKNELAYEEGVLCNLNKSMYMLNEIRGLACDREYIPKIYKSNFFLYENLIKDTFKTINSCKMEYTNSDKIFEKYIFKYAYDIERIELLTSSIRCKFKKNYDLINVASYEVLELLELNWKWNNPYRTPNDGLKEGLNFIHEIYRQAKENFKGHKNERRILVYILYVISSYNHNDRSLCIGYKAHDSCEFKPGQMWVEEQCRLHKISRGYY